MNPNESRNILNSSRTLDRAAIFEGNTQKPFNFQRVTLDLSVAQLETNPKIFSFPFKSIYIQSTTDSNVSVNFKPNAVESFQSAITLGQNDTLTFSEPVASGNLYWNAQPGKSITIIFTINGELRSGKLISVTSGGVSVTEGSVAEATEEISLLAATATEIAPQNLNRKVSIIENSSSNDMFISGVNTVTNTGATRGIKVQAGDIIEWRNTAALYGYMVLAGSVNRLDLE